MSPQKLTFPGPDAIRPDAIPSTTEDELYRNIAYWINNDIKSKKNLRVLFK